MQSCELKIKSVLRDPYRCSDRQIGWVCRTTWSAFLIESLCGAGLMLRFRETVSRRRLLFSLRKNNTRARTICGKARQETSEDFLSFVFSFLFSLCFSLFSGHPMLRAIFTFKSRKIVRNPREIFFKQKPSHLK